MNTAVRGVTWVNKARGFDCGVVQTWVVHY